MIVRFLFLAALLLPALALGAQPETTRETPPRLAGNRYLFVVENSAAMQKRDQKLHQTMFNLVYDGVFGRMTSGDTFGVWTFNTETDAKFPMQVWSPAKRSDLGSRIITLLNDRGYGRRSNLEYLIRDLNAVVKSVKDLTVILITDGSDRISGTPFDREINKIFRELGPNLARAKEPFITSLYAEDGKFNAYFVSRPGETISLPPPPQRVLPKRPPSNRQPKNEVVEKAPTPSPARQPAGRFILPIVITKENSPPEPLPTPTPTSSTPTPTLTPPPRETGTRLASVTNAPVATHPTPLAPAGEINLKEALPPIFLGEETPLAFVATPTKPRPDPRPDQSAANAVSIEPDRGRTTSVPSASASSSEGIQPSARVSVPVVPLLSPVPVQARQAAQETHPTPVVTAVSLPSAPRARTHGKLIVSAILLVGAIGWGLVYFYRNRAIERGSYISRALPRPPGSSRH